MNREGFAKRLNIPLVIHCQAIHTIFINDSPTSEDHLP